MKHQANAYQQAVGQLMRERRKELDVSIAYVSRTLDGRYSPAAISAWERGDRNIRVEYLADLAGVYGVTTRDLMPADPEGYWWST
jgi:transcriptional regulator with XRE-family HTH domain